MRQAVRMLLISGMLLPMAACGTATNPAPGEPAAGIGSATAAAPEVRASEASTKASCEALGQAYSKNMAPLAEALTKLATVRGSAGDDKVPQGQVRQALTTFAAAIGGATQGSTDPQLRADGKKTAAKLTAKAADKKVFSEVKTTDDVNTALGSTLKQWLSAVDQQCS
jgi:hypothetical protein